MSRNGPKTAENETEREIKKRRITVVRTSRELGQSNGEKNISIYF